MNESARFFETTAPISFGGPQAPSPLAFRWYDKDRIVRGKRLEEHLRFAVCYWHSLCWVGSDPFGGETFLRPWHHGTDAMALARAKRGADLALLDAVHRNPQDIGHDLRPQRRARSATDEIDFADRSS